MPPILLIDSGTSTTRVRLVQDGRVQLEIRRAVGAAAGAGGQNAELRQALSACLAEMAEARPEAMAAVPAALLSGMISAPSGLEEIAHLTGPVDLGALHQAVVWRQYPDLWDRPMGYIPGVKFVSGDLVDQDVVRGEETELAGYALDHPGDFLALHVGSHHKALWVRDGWLTASRTALTGEMLTALATGTILKDSITLPAGGPEDLEAARQGARDALQVGTARALFLTRVMRLNAGASEASAASYYMGALAAEDLRMLLGMRLPELPLLLYGREGFCKLLAELVAEHLPGNAAAVLGQQQSDDLAVLGASRVAQALQEEGRFPC